MREAVHVVLETADEARCNRHQLLCRPLPVQTSLLRVFLSIRFAEPAQALCRWEAVQRSLRVDVVEPLVLHEELHDGFVEGGGEEESRREERVDEELEEDAEGRRRLAQSSARIVARRNTLLDQRFQHLTKSSSFNQSSLYFLTSFFKWIT